MGTQEIQVKRNIVSDDGMFFKPVRQLGCDGAEEGRTLDLVLGNTGKSLDELGNRTARINKGLEGVGYSWLSMGSEPIE